MPGLKRLGLMILVLFGPGLLIYFFAKSLSNQFIDLPYIGKHEVTIGADGEADTTYYTLPHFTFKNLKGKTVNSVTTQNQFLIFTTIQNGCPDTCGLFMYHIDELFYEKLLDNKDNYHNVKIISVLTDENGNRIDRPSEKLLELMLKHNVDSSLWEIVTGDPAQVFDFEYEGENFMELPSTEADFEIGQYAFVNSMVLVDKTKHIRGFTGAKKDSDIRNFFDLLKILKKVEFDENRKSK